jgi:hypothetical protein
VEGLLGELSSCVSTAGGPRFEKLLSSMSSLFDERKEAINTVLLSLSSISEKECARDPLRFDER